MVEKAVRLIFALLAMPVLLLSAGIAQADDGLTVISDAETQNYLAKITKPLFEAAGVRFDAGSIFVIDDNSLNAFVSDGNYLFVHSGTIIQAGNTNELEGIIAHETGHILGGHIVRLKLKLENMQYIMLGSALAAGAAAVSTGRGDAAMAVLLGSQTSALNSMLHYQVQEERSADESAVKLLSKTHRSTNGLLNFMNKIKKQNALAGVEESPYFRTHPLTSERIAHFKEACKNNRYPESSTLDGEFALVKAKLSAFLLDEAKVRRMYPSSDRSDAAEYARSILAFRHGRTDEASAIINSLIKKQPRNPYFYEMKGQILFEGGRVKESISAYSEALKLLPGNNLLQINLAHALLESGGGKNNSAEAVNLLQKSLVKSDSPFAWLLLSQAYEREGKAAEARYAAAEFNYSIGNTETAKRLAEYANKNSADKALKLKASDLLQKIKEDERERQF